MGYPSPRLAPRGRNAGPLSGFMGCGHNPGEPDLTLGGVVSKQVKNRDKSHKRRPGRDATPFLGWALKDSLAPLAGEPVREVNKSPLIKYIYTSHQGTEGDRGGAKPPPPCPSPLRGPCALFYSKSLPYFDCSHLSTAIWAFLSALRTWMSRLTSSGRGIVILLAPSLQREHTASRFSAVSGPPIDLGIL